MATYQRYLVVNHAGEMKLAKRHPDLYHNEVAFLVKVHIPDGPWGQLQRGVAEVEVPQAAAARMEFAAEPIEPEEAES
jgi:hypothetical protein